MSSTHRHRPARTPAMPALPLPVGFGPPLHRQGLVLRPAQGPTDHAQLLALRALCYRGDAGACDADNHDPDCLHLWIGPPGSPPLATLRLRHHVDAASVMGGYTARFFDLAALARLPGTVLEPGRLALHPDAPAAALMRLIWTGIARMTQRTGAARLIGCTSLPGADPARHAALLAHLARYHLGPAGLRPAARGPRAPLTAQSTHAALSAAGAGNGADTGLSLPPVLRSYLSLDGWVGDQLALDGDLDTCVLFTCVETATIPPAQARLMQALAAQ